MEEMEEINSAKELLDSTLKVMDEKKVTNGALKDVKNRILDSSSGDKNNLNLVLKSFARKGDAWVGGNPLILDMEAKKKDSISSVFIKLADVIKAFEEYNCIEELDEYFNEMKNIGIEINVNPDSFAHADTSQVDILEELQSAKSYINTLDEYNDEIKEQHAPKAEELNFAPSKAYTKMVALYKKGMKGKDIDDDVQNILTYNEMVDTATNLIHDEVARALGSEEE